MILYYVACDANTVVVDDDRTRVPMSFVTQTTQSTTVPTRPRRPFRSCCVDRLCVDKRITHNILTPTRRDDTC
jgi:hypothetical protein